MSPSRQQSTVGTRQPTEKSDEHTPAKPTQEPVDNTEQQETANGQSAEDDGDDIESLLEAMTGDLLETTKRNQQRALYLESVAQATFETPKEHKQRQQFEAGLYARHSAIIKRTKETRAKAGKNKNAKNDDLALPW